MCYVNLFQHLMVVGLENTKDPRAKAMAFDLASKWLNNNRLAYEQSDGAMFEKVLYLKSFIFFSPLTYLYFILTV